MIIIPAMGPCPKLHIFLSLERNAPTLRALAIVLDQIAQTGSCEALCAKAENHLYDGNFHRSAAHNASRAFRIAVGCELYPHAYLTDYILGLHPNMPRGVAAAVRPIWAAHIARSIYEQIGDRP